MLREAFSSQRKVINIKKFQLIKTLFKNLKTPFTHKDNRVVQVPKANSCNRPRFPDCSYIECWKKKFWNWWCCRFPPENCPKKAVNDCCKPSTPTCMTRNSSTCPPPSCLPPCPPSSRPQCEPLCPTSSEPPSSPQISRVAAKVEVNCGGCGPCSTTTVKGPISVTEVIKQPGPPSCLPQAVRPIAPVVLGRSPQIPRPIRQAPPTSTSSPSQEVPPVFIREEVTELRCPPAPRPPQPCHCPHPIPKLEKECPGPCPRPKDNEC